METKELDRMKRRLMAIDLARSVTNLTTEQYFDAVCAALKQNDRQGFLDLCKRAGIPDEAAEQLWECILEFIRKLGRGWVGLP